MSNKNSNIPPKKKGTIRIRVNHLGIGQLEGSGNGKFCKEESAKLLENIGTILKSEVNQDFYTNTGFSEEVVKNV